MKIQAINKNIKSMKLSVPVDGLIEIDENGMAEVSSKCGKMLIEGTNDWKEFKGDKEDSDEKKVDEQGSNGGEQTSTDTAEENEDAAEQGSEQTEDEQSENADEKPADEQTEDADKQPTDEEIIEGLKKLSLEDCIATAKEAGYPEKEWEKLSKNEKAAEKMMRNYLVKKYKESVKK